MTRRGISLDVVFARSRFLFGWLLLCSPGAAIAQPPAVAHPPAHAAATTEPAAIVANAQLVEKTERSIGDLGAIQGVSERDGKLYVYGDLVLAEPRVGMIREYDRELKPTGRSIRLIESGRPLIVHPTGLTWSAAHGCFLGDTFEKKATIYRIDWDEALARGTLDGAVLAKIADDAAVNGCRPLFVTVGDREWLATADYGDVRPEIRLLDPEKLVAAGRTSAPGVIGARILCGPFNQNLSWDPARKRLTCVQNVVSGEGWRLDVLDLERATADGRATGPQVRVETLTFAGSSELEGYLPLGADRGLFVTADFLRPNAIFARVERTPIAETVPSKSPAP